MTFQQLVARFKLIHTLVMEKVGFSCLENENDEIILEEISRSVSF